MKKLSISIIFLLFIQLCAAQTVKNSLIDQHLKGKVKKIETTVYSGKPVDGKIDTLIPSAKGIDLYNEKGNEVEENYFDKDGSLISKFIEKYNEKNEKIEQNYFTKSDVQESTTIFKYDEKGNLIESDQDFVSDKKYDNKELYKYDDKGNNVEDDIYNADGGLKYKDTYKYDNKGNKIEMDYWHGKEDTIRVKWVFNYNAAGVRIQEGRYTPDGVLGIENMMTFENFDKRGNWLLQTRKSKGQSKQYADLLNYSVTKRKIYYY